METVETTQTQQRSDEKWMEREKAQADSRPPCEQLMDAVDGMPAEYVRDLAKQVRERRAALVTLNITTTEDEQPEDEQTRQRLIDFFAGLDARSKIAVALYSELAALDGLSFDAKIPRGQRLIDEINTALDVTDDARNDAELSWLQGIREACGMVQQAC